MSVKYNFLSWKEAFIDSLSKWFFDTAEIKDHLDLSGYYLFCPVARVSRRLIEKLVFACEQKKIALSAPRLVGPSNIYDTLLPAYKIISAAESRLIFLSILEQNKNSILFSSSEKNELQLLDRAGFLAQTYLDLTKNAEPAEKSINKLLASDLLADQQRWLDLMEIFRAYKKILKERNLIDSVDALEIVQKQPVKIQQQLILIGSFDLAEVTLKTIQAGFENINCFIFADHEELADKNSHTAFGPLGSLNTDYWQKYELNITGNQFKVMTNSSSEIEYLLSEIQKLPTNTRASEITVGSCAADLDKYFAFKAKQNNLAIHLAAGSGLLNSEASQCLIAALSYINTKSFSTLSYLLSVPAFYNKLDLSEQAKICLDNYRIDHLQASFSQKLPALNEQEKSLLDQIHELLSVLSSSPNTSSGWLQSCKQFLAKLCLEPNEAISVLKVLQELLLPIKLEISIKAVLALITEALSAATQSSHSSQDEIDLVGWLELALDDADYCFVIGMNEKNLPAALSSNSLMPETVRRFLGLDSYQNRLARDKYILQSLIKSKKQLGLSCSRSSLEGDGMMISRLFLEGSDSNKLSNLKKFFKEVQSCSPVSGSATSVFNAVFKDKLVPGKTDWKADIISVSALNTYQICPYLFYLQHVLKLNLKDPESRELTGAQLGNIVHDLLADFGNNALKDSTSAGEIEEFLLDKLKYYFNREFSSSTFAEVQVQYYQIIQRLQRFASWQAAWRRQGWQIHFVERSFSQANPYKINNKSGSLNIIGRIDRIDFNPELQQYTIFDYKTSDTVSPNIYSTKNGWNDLQLAVYSLYCQEILNLNVSQVAQIAVSADDTDINPVLLKLETEHIEAIKAVISDISESLLTQVFWPPKIRANQAHIFRDIYQALEN